MSTLLKKAKKLPDAPGVYFFLGPRKEILYVGKAASLHERIKSYFGKDVGISRSPLIKRMVDEARDISFRKTDSVLEAVILEADLIKKFKPKYNSKEKDDKSFNYVAITKEDFPRVLLVRGKNLERKDENKKFESYYGPFPQAGILREALSIVRKISPFRGEKCLPAESSAQADKPDSGKPCFDRQIGLCPGVCTGEISRREYRKTIRNIKLLFSGEKKTLLRTLKKEMREAAKAQEFEKAAALRNQISALEHIHDISLLKSPFFLFGKKNPEHLRARLDKENKRRINRIEAYDIAHLTGAETVGVMVVLEEGEIKRGNYRTFMIKRAAKKSDTGALRETLERRFAHPEWKFPDILVVDGGKAQVNTARSVLFESGLEYIALVGVVKDEHHRPKNIIGDKNIIPHYEKEILLANNESHRFAIKFHRKKIRRRV